MDLPQDLRHAPVIPGQQFGLNSALMGMITSSRNFMASAIQNYKHENIDQFQNRQLYLFTYLVYQVPRLLYKICYYQSAFPFNIMKWLNAGTRVDIQINHEHDRNQLVNNRPMQETQYVFLRVILYALQFFSLQVIVCYYGCWFAGPYIILRVYFAHSWIRSIVGMYFSHLAIYFFTVCSIILVGELKSAFPFYHPWHIVHNIRPIITDIIISLFRTTKTLVAYLLRKIKEYILNSGNSYTFHRQLILSTAFSRTLLRASPAILLQLTRLSCPASSLTHRLFAFSRRQIDLKLQRRHSSCFRSN